MKKYIIKNAILVDAANNLHQVKKDVAVSDGLIEKIDENINIPDYETIDAKGEYLCAGMIDIHIHNQMSPELSLDSVDHLGVYRGVTSVIECGSTPLCGIDKFKKESDEAKTRYYTLLSGHGEDGWGKYGSQDPEKMFVEHYKEAVDKLDGKALGLKVACSNTITNDKGYGLVKKSKEICKALGLPLTIHVGNFPPDPCGLVEFLDEGDVLTHCCHGKEVSLFKSDGTLKTPFVRARNRGVLFDIGHGSASFSWIVYDKARRKGFKPDLIGTDIRKVNIDGPVHSQAVVLSKIINLGLSLEEVIKAVTYTAAKAYHLDELGQLKVGKKADFTFFTIEDVDTELVDCYGQYQPIKTLIKPTQTIVSKEKDSELYICNEGFID